MLCFYTFKINSASSSCPADLHRAIVAAYSVPAVQSFDNFFGGF